MNKLDTNKKCIKCGYFPSFQKSWILEFNDDCSSFGYNRCDWDDSQTKEHLHVTCPECGYKVNAPCLDMDEVVGGTWSTATELAKTEAVSTVVAPVKPPTPYSAPARVETPGYVAPVTPVSTPDQPAKCRTCPVDVAEAK